MEDDHAQRNCNHAHDDGHQQDDEPDRDAAVVGHQTKAVAPQPDEELRTEGNLAEISSRQVPHLRHQEEDQDLAQKELQTRVEKDGGGDRRCGAKGQDDKLDFLHY